MEEFDITGTVSEDSITEKNSTINKNGILVSFNTEELNFDCYIASFEIYIGDGTQIDESFYYYNPVPLQPTEDTYGRLEVDGLGEVLDALDSPDFQCNHPRGTHTARVRGREADGSFSSRHSAAYPIALCRLLALGNMAGAG